MNDKIRVCLIGCGRAGLIHAKSYAGPVDGAELIAVCDADENNVEAAQRIANVRYFYTDYREALKNNEMISCALLQMQASTFSAKSRWRRHRKSAMR